MLAVGVGGLEVALAMAGEPLHVTMPEVWGINLVGELPDWVSAKDVILEMLRRHDVKGGRGRILEYHGPGLEHLRAMDRHVIANMGAELGATTTVFPSDEETRRFLTVEGREDAWTALVADADATYDIDEEVDLSSLAPLIAKPSSPGSVVPVSEVAGEPVSQVVVGSSANPGLRDFAMVAEIVKGRRTVPSVSFDVNPTSRQTLENLAADGHLLSLVHAGARLHQAGCMGCIGMGQAPATGQNSLRTFPRNFPGRSGTRDDRVFLCSPETAAAAALTGEITDPRTLDMDYPRVDVPDRQIVNADMIEPPPEDGSGVELVKGPNITSLPEFDPLPDRIEGPVLLKVGDNVSTDEIMPAGSRVLPFRSNIPKMAEFAFDVIDESYPARATEVRDAGGHLVVGGENYGQGSSREHAAIAPHYLGLRAVIAKNFARIHWQNLVNFGVLPLEFEDAGDYDRVEQDDVLVLNDLGSSLDDADRKLEVENTTKSERYELTHHLSRRQVEVIRAGGLIPVFKTRLKG
jgi:aconitate hydratase